MDVYFWVHLVLAVLITAYFAWRYWKERLTYELLFVIWVPTTLLGYLSANGIYRVVLVVFQLVMFGLVLFFMFRKPPQKNDPPEETQPGAEENLPAEDGETDEQEKQ